MKRLAGGGARNKIRARATHLAVHQRDDAINESYRRAMARRINKGWGSAARHGKNGDASIEGVAWAARSLMRREAAAQV